MADLHTPAQHLDAAMGFLREIVDDEESGTANRLNAAANLAKLAQAAPAPEAEKLAMQLTDDQLLAIILKARDERERRSVVTPLPTPLLPGATQLASDPSPVNPAGEGSTWNGWSEGGPDDRSVAREPDALDSLFDDVPDLPRLEPGAPTPDIAALCS